ncbi:uncharacterized protein LOC102808030 [Saccoglossus kowalevskii]|uniref:Uncharacterized protein LOC102808030 n=1 Tax=Saccoglossus kowalevskii TaxID=10224 RepID=A0ABM0MRY9_SACKO|nr:PREDICTED: uncharacterized protein LOC102808030 [Saccoglossus kowalevskii]
MLFVIPDKMSCYLRALSFTIFCVLPVIAQSSIYKYVTIDSCRDGIQRTVDTDAAAGEIVVDIAQSDENTGSCHLTLNVSKGKRIALFFDKAFYFPVVHTSSEPECTLGALEIRDGLSGDLLTPTPICGVVQEMDIRPMWMEPYFSNSNSMTFSISARSGDLRGTINFKMKFIVFVNVSDDSCFTCPDLVGFDFPLCIDNRLKCDNVNNCPDGSDEDYRYTKNKTCDLKCLNGPLAYVDGNKACDGEKTCADGSDESVEMCGLRQSKPFSTLSMTDIVVSIICFIFLAILFCVCIYCYCCPPPPSRYKKAYKRAKKERRYQEQMMQQQAMAGMAPHGQNAQQL